MLKEFSSFQIRYNEIQEEKKIVVRKSNLSQARDTLFGHKIYDLESFKDGEAHRYLHLSLNAHLHVIDFDYIFSIFSFFKKSELANILPKSL